MDPSWFNEELLVLLGKLVSLILSVDESSPLVVSVAKGMIIFLGASDWDSNTLSV